MKRTFAATLAELRRRSGLSQRKVANDLNISQALLSHYENGAREPGLEFVCHACDYYGVSADYLLCRTGSSGPGALKGTPREMARTFLSELKELTERAEDALEELE